MVKDLPTEIRWAKKHGNGFDKTTTTTSFCINRGHPGCRHTAIPVRV